MPGSTTTPAEAERISGAELLNHGERLRPGLVERQAEAERLRRLPEATMAAFHEAGILRAIQPIVFGGFEADFINRST
jgi:3-hydroxy-9,10-secoandrosta-1,3,5(10)-triene-9,17-dione monooxygenase